MKPLRGYNSKFVRRAGNRSGGLQQASYYEIRPGNGDYRAIFSAICRSTDGLSGRFRSHCRHSSRPGIPPSTTEAPCFGRLSEQCRVEYGIQERGWGHFPLRIRLKRS